ncbi:hypothetical protein [Pseudothauera rhizosphaerae]|uniref:Uncharacterized protein n=1 Tax=Pseudothauera rhizosphaerae TaxID=2565932 RepID=A0A4S4AWP8_9RHOO|nr:hypothetical protein [Pseudothauera rhizosphaerae]THF64327.1 hypothetical protein E6O51_03180 [Pseudothauera rhizosphaerae]
MSQSEKIITARAKAFSTEPMQEYRFRVSESGEVSVYDGVAGYIERAYLTGWAACHESRARRGGEPSS